ncbi:MAG: hypothetical protein ACLSG5_11900 [Oscillospiraceae bacterium]
MPSVTEITVRCRDRLWGVTHHAVYPGGSRYPHRLHQNAAGATPRWSAAA